MQARTVMDINKVSITRRLEATLNGLMDEFRAIYDVSDFDRAVAELKRSANRSDHSSKLKRLQKMLDLCGIEYESGQSDEYYERLVSEADIPTFEENEARILGALFARYGEYPSPEEYMKRIVDRLSCPEDGWQDDTLRLRILRQFIKYGNYLSEAGCGGKTYIRRYAKEHSARGNSTEEVLRCIDDGVFDALFSPDADKAKKKFKGMYGLLKTADDLAAGKFRVWGATKQNLYLFAMVYGMTYSSGDSTGDLPDLKKDIEINLFRDYYTNNIVRLITEAYRGRIQEYEADPSGQGINYRNYAEMVYLYYISRDMLPEEKIRRSHEMIESIKSEMVGKGAPPSWGEKTAAGNLSRRAVVRDKEQIECEQILELPEDEFRAFLCGNYFCDTSGSYAPDPNAVSRFSPLQLETGQEAAAEEYTMILDGLEDLGISPESCRYGLWFTDVDAFCEKGAVSLRSVYPDMDETRCAEFMDLLLGINSFIGHISPPEEVTRTAMITAFYYYYNALRIGDDINGARGFEEVFNEFKRDVDGYLEEAGYQLFSGRNLLDVLVAFSSYAYIYM